MRFTLINSKKKSPFFSLGRNRDVFIILAAAEIALLMLMLLLFVKLRTMVDAPLLISAMLIVMDRIRASGLAGRSTKANPSAESPVTT